MATSSMISPRSSSTGRPRLETGIQTGFTDLDRLLSPGLAPGQLVLVTGCPAVGKTTLMINLVRHAAIRQGVVSTILTLELNEHDIMQRIISAEARIAAHVLASGQLLDDDWAKLTHRTGEIRSAPLTVCQVRGASLADLTSTITNAVEQDHTRLVAIDSIRQIRFDDIDQDSLPATCRALKRLAVQLGVTILAVVPSPDRIPLHEGESPDLANLGELAGHVTHISEDADIVILIHRDDQYDLESPRAGEADLIVAKHRNGPCDIIVTAAQLHLCRFVDMAIG
ncbi:DnaB-like helicase C-terminal domain-containing protein [Rhizocola hellebori]|nr:DnaB-like helicase C-terminal domain-containing protein [Rhizocola hellebori]